MRSQTVAEKVDREGAMPELKFGAHHVRGSTQKALKTIRIAAESTATVANSSTAYTQATPALFNGVEQTTTAAKLKQSHHLLLLGAALQVNASASKRLKPVGPCCFRMTCFSCCRNKLAAQYFDQIQNADH